MDIKFIDLAWPYLAFSSALLGAWQLQFVLLAFVLHHRLSSTLTSLSRTAKVACSPRTPCFRRQHQPLNRIFREERNLSLDTLLHVSGSIFKHEACMGICESPPTIWSTLVAPRAFCQKKSRVRLQLNSKFDSYSNKAKIFSPIYAK